MNKEKRYHNVYKTSEEVEKIRNGESEILSIKKTKEYRMGDYVKIIVQEGGQEKSICKKIMYIMHSKDNQEEMVLGLNKGTIAKVYKKEWAA